MAQRRLDSGLYGSIFSSSGKGICSRILTKMDLSKTMSSLCPVVIYLTGDDDDEEIAACEAIESTFEDLKILSQRIVASPDFQSTMQRVGFVRRPRVFFRGRYIGGLKEVSSLNLIDAAHLEAPAASCSICGAHKFTLLSTHNLIPCTACAYQRSNDTDTNKLFICFQGEDSNQRHIYVICSLDAQQPYKHIITTEAIIRGYPFMGFGVYNSKIVLAGGQDTEDENITYNGCITFDMKTRLVDYNPFPVLMSHGKLKPLVFQLDYTLKTHPNYIWDTWSTYLEDEPLPFTGVATYHTQDGFDDFVMIYFDKGALRVCKFDLNSLGDSQELFTPHKPDENVQAYFADLGSGCFCLTTFDDIRVYVCTFVVTREGTPSDPLRVTHSIQSNHNFYFDKLFSDGMKITSVVGCSAATPNEEAKSRVEKAESIFYKYHKKMQDDYDISELEIEGKSLILEDVKWKREDYSEGEEMLLSDP